MLLASCSSAPKVTTPALNPQEAAELLHYNNRAQDWLKVVKKQNPACDYQLNLPDQSSHPTQIDLDHIMLCGNRPSPKEFDATVSFAYDATPGKWSVIRFAS